jgi:chromosome segregation protein
MLLRLELTGFKSFADKTCFDFAPGITAIVGPNGSGKSNVVDAIRWILGEQSVRSLRGGEMADVIFHGSAKRKSLGMAEVSIVLDNRRRLLAIETDQVQLTRRVYRDGTGEYLINGQPARLKDFKDIFLGSGAGTKGYTIIAQGRVEELLQADPRQRRELFDEAAGISRFKIRKEETLRKLTTVESNLARSQDRLQHLLAQLRTCRLQAAKSQKYQEYHTRLQQLRLIWGKYENHRLQLAIQQVEQRIHQRQLEIDEYQNKVQTYNHLQNTCEQKLDEYEKKYRELSTILADCERQIATEKITIRHLHQNIILIENDILQLHRRRSDITRRIRSVEKELQESSLQLKNIESEIQSINEEKQRWEAAVATIHSRCQEIDAHMAQLREQQFDAVRVAAAAKSAANSAHAHLTRLQQELQRRHSDSTQAAMRRQTLQKTLEELIKVDQQAQENLQEIIDKINQYIRQKQQLQEMIQVMYDELDNLRVQYSDYRARLELLDEWERTYAGVGEGIRQLLEKRSQLTSTDPHHPLVTETIGLVADLLIVPPNIAPLVEIALGDKAQHLLVRSEGSLLTLLTPLQEHLTGRAGLLPLRPPTPPPFPLPPEIKTLADQIDSPIAGLAAQLLGDVILAEDWEQAISFRERYVNFRILTRQGHLWGTDGSVTFGPLHSARGLVSQKSELRELRGQAHRILDQLQQKENSLISLQQNLKQIDDLLTEAEMQRAMLEKAAFEARQKLDKHRQDLEHWEERWALLCQEAENLEEELRRAESAWLQSHQQAERAEQAAEHIQRSLEQLQQSLRVSQEDYEVTRDHLHTTAMKLSQVLALQEHHKDHLTQLHTEIRKRRVEILDVQSAMHALRTRHQAATLDILHTESRLSQLYADKEKAELYLQQISQSREAERRQWNEYRSDFQNLQQSLDQLRQHLHQLAMQQQDLRNQHQYLHLRLQDELQLDSQSLHSLLNSQGEVCSNPDEVVQEMEQLKQKITRLGAVNMEALEQLQALEKEYEAHLSQHKDLQQAQRALLEIIEQLNNDSCKLFLDMLTMVRGHFQELFRKLFGGGQADIVLENEADVLDSGVDIIARPPGKELRSLSLLSGGEKTLTAIALLLAIFRAKPSPFCILDEVDAALDEANTVRLASVLREFLDVSQFIIVTHKKRTMAAADRLWGVTMTDQGVSRLLPLRFEDWESPSQAA